MSRFCSILIIGVLFSIPVLLVILIIRAIKKKPIKKISIGLVICVASILPLTILGALTDPATLCKHERELISETRSTCTVKGKVVEYCDICDVDVTTYKDKLPHDYQVSETKEATCTASGHIIKKCTMCSSTQKTNIEAFGHELSEVSRTEPTNETDGKVVNKCERCGHEEIEIIPRDESTSNNDEFISGDFGEVSGDELPNVESDNLVNELIGIGFTAEEAAEYREVFLKCGINSIEGAKPTSTTATIDDLVAYRIVMDEDRTLWFTIDKRELFYIALNGTDVYDTSKGGFLISIDDVHIPENDITRATADKLRDKTTAVLEPYFINALYYDGWRYGRSDDTYAVQCEVYAQNRLGIKDWIFAKVWYEFDGTNFVVTGIVIDGVRYK